MTIYDLVSVVNSAELEDDSPVLFKYIPVHGFYYFYDYAVVDESLVLYFVKDRYFTKNYPLSLSDLKAVVEMMNDTIEVCYRTFGEAPEGELIDKAGHRLSGAGIADGVLTLYPVERYYAEEEVKHGFKED